MGLVKQFQVLRAESFDEQNTLKAWFINMINFEKDHLSAKTLSADQVRPALAYYLIKKTSSKNFFVENRAKGL